MTISLIFTGLLRGQDLFPNVWPEFEPEPASGRWTWWINLGMHVQGIDRPVPPDSGEFYDRFRDYDDFVKHTRRPSYFALEISRSFPNGWSILHRTEVYPNWMQTEKDIRYPVAARDLDSHTNARGFLQKTGRNYGIKIGRDFLVWDPIWTGTLLPDQIPSFDQVRLDLWGQRWYYHAFVGDINRRDVFNNVDQYKYLAAHRLDFMPFTNLLVWVAEIQIVTRSLSLADLNPFFLVYHNLERIHRTHNAITSLGLRWKVRQNLEVSVEFDIDELESAAFEYYTANQNAFAYQVGVLHQRFQVSYVQTWPWVYNHEAKTEAHSTTFVFSESQDRKGPVYFDRFVGYPMGSGARILQAGMEAIPGLGIHYRHLERNPSHILEPISTLESPEPVETRNRVAVTYEKELATRFAARMVLSWEHSLNYRHSSEDATLTEWLVGIAYRFSNSN
ncbi:MAG: hypothetical protein ACE5HZ_07615 [Fidelibacterota bacterium]